ncbi:hypothetical protein RclHR1_07510011 [Rhizophagus clarus]|uniref:G domain-containing protein n=1 Tax=Rhizophagus clarus TaxID=94130 RepID=A0A2Z6S908_9GLOM|nr:hypothetical protein RclHR1_07510011 [Rhizophagus clarus]GET04652.1 hypothetical protein GLOIN_2v1872166 [Rhizophagus clarus]
MKKTILAIGSTGLGKTTMARLLCGANVEGSSGTDSSTKEAEIHETDEFLYIDTRGFGDSFGTPDEEIFHDMMRLFQRHGKNNIFNIDIILWFCSESGREMDHLRREAKFIQRFTEYTDGCESIDIWKNVLIITKGTFPSRELVNGPKSAAKNACQAFYNMQINEDFSFIKHFPCWIYDIDSLSRDSILWAKMDPETRLDFNCYSQDEIKSKIQHFIPDFSPISVHFKKGKCQKCDSIGDPRLFSSRCHTTLTFKHSIEIDYFHPEQTVRFHSGSKFLGHEPDETSIKKFLENKLASNPNKPPESQVSSEIGEEIVELSKSDLDGFQMQETPEPPQPSRMSQIISQVSQAASKASRVAVSLLPTVAVARNITFGSVTGGVAYTPSVYLLSAASTSVAVLAVCIGGVMYYYETKHIKCKMCKRFIGEIGCIEKCDNCKEEWEKTGCETGYGCCKQKEETLGCQACEKCTICQETAIKLNSQGCRQCCAKCKEMWNTPGCDVSFEHNVVMID